MILIDRAVAEESIQQKAAVYAGTGDEHCKGFNKDRVSPSGRHARWTKDVVFGAREASFFQKLLAAE